MEFLVKFPSDLPCNFWGEEVLLQGVLLLVNLSSIGVSKEVLKIIDLLRKILVASIGAAVLTREKVEGLVDELVKRGEIASKEGPKLVKELLKESQKAKKELEEKIEEATQKTLKKLRLATRAEIEELKIKLEKLEKKIGKMEEKE